MARSFNGSSDSIVLANKSVLDVTTQLSISAWVNVTTAPANNTQEVIVINGSGTNTRNWFLDYRQVSGVFSIELSNNIGGNFGELRAVTTLSTNVWHNIVFTVDWTQVPWVSTCYVDGASVSVSNVGGITSGTPPASDVGRNIGSNAGISSFWNGKLAEIAVWKGVLLTQGEAKSLSLGARAFNVRGGSVIGYWALDGIQSPEPDLSGNTMNGTLTGTALAFGPPIALFTPRWPQFNLIPAVTPASLVFSQQTITIPILMTVPITVTAHG